MARIRQTRKNRSSRPTIRQKPKSKRTIIKGNPIVAAHWDKSLTLSQNYRRLGLTSKLNRPTGGVELTTVPSEDEEQRPTSSDPLAIRGDQHVQKVVSSVKVIRDAEGKIISVIQDEEQKRDNPLNDPLDQLSDEETDILERGVSKGIVPELEEASRMVKKKVPRKQSKRDQEWIERLIGKWGDDLAGMSRDTKLNPTQHSAGELRKRIKLFQQNRARTTNEMAVA